MVQGVLWQKIFHFAVILLSGAYIYWLRVHAGWRKMFCFVLIFVWSLHLLLLKMINILGQHFLQGDKVYCKDPATSFHENWLFKHNVPELSVCLIWCLPQPAPPPFWISCWCKNFFKDNIKEACMHINSTVLLSTLLAFMLCKCKRMAVREKLATKQVVI